jgi:hypothetical protein
VCAGDPADEQEFEAFVHAQAATLLRLADALTGDPHFTYFLRGHTGHFGHESGRKVRKVKISQLL